MRQDSFNARRLAAVCGGLIALGLLAGAPALAASQSLAGVTEALAHCRHTADVAARAACYDHVTDALLAGAPAPAPRSAPAAAKPPQSVETAPRSASATADQDETVRTRMVRAIATVGRTQRGYLRLTTDAGEVWEQTEAFNVTQLPHAGDKLVITRTFLGGHWCRLSSKSVFHCKQAN